MGGVGGVRRGQGSGSGFGGGAVVGWQGDIVKQFPSCHQDTDS